MGARAVEPARFPFAYAQLERQKPTGGQESSPNRHIARFPEHLVGFASGGRCGEFYDATHVPTYARLRAETECIGRSHSLSLRHEI